MGSDSPRSSPPTPEEGHDRPDEPVVDEPVVDDVGEDSPSSDADRPRLTAPDLPSSLETAELAAVETRLSWVDGPPPDAAPTIGRYRLVGRIAAGGMGTVYEAVHELLDKRVALKVLPLGMVNQPDAVARFRREMRAIGQLDHPGLVTAVDADEADGLHYLAMERVDGVNLADLATRYEADQGRPLPPRLACELVGQAAAAMQAAHRSGLVHRDLKPSNLMLATDGTVRVLDLGLAMLSPGKAELLDGGESESGGSEAAAVNPSLASGSDQLLGTVDYMAPEQASESHAVDGRADIYSLGATLYRLVAGQPPYPSTRYRSLLKKLVAVATQPPQPIAEVRSDCPPPLADLIAWMMARDPADRPESMADVERSVDETAAAIWQDSPDADAGPASLVELVAMVPPRPPEPIGPRDMPLLGQLIVNDDSASHWTMSIRGPAGEPDATDRRVDQSARGAASMPAASGPAGLTGLNELAGLAGLTGTDRPIDGAGRRRPGLETLAALAAAALLVLVGWVLVGPIDEPAAGDQPAGAAVTAEAERDAERREPASALGQLPGAAVQLTGSDRVTLDGIPLDFRQPATVELLVRVDAIDEAADYLPELVLSRMGFAIRLNRSRGTWDTQVWDADRNRAQFLAESPIRHPAGAASPWTLITVTWDGSQMAMFVDGEPATVKVDQTDRALGELLPFSSPCCGPITLGERKTPNEFARGITGTIAAVHISNRVRNVRRAVGQPRLLSRVGDATLAAYWAEQTGPEWPELSGRAAHGRLTGAGWVTLDDPRQGPQPGAAD